MEKEAVLKMNNFCPINPQKDISHGNFKNGLVSALNRQDTRKRSATQRLSAAKVMVNLEDGGNQGLVGHRVRAEGAWQLSCLEGLWGQGAWAVSAAPLLGAPMLDIAGHHTVYIPVTTISFPGYGNLDTALTPELAGEGWVNDAMVPFISVPPSTHNPGKAELGSDCPQGHSWEPEHVFEFTVSFIEALAGPMQTFKETVFLLENTFTKH